MTDLYVVDGPAFRIVEVSGDLAYAVEMKRQGDDEAVQIAAFKSHVEATAWILAQLIDPSTA